MSTTPSPPRRLTGDARRWTAARTEYLAGADPEVVCRRHDIRTATFLRLAGEQGWRRPDPAPAPAVQDDPLVIPEASQAPSGTPQPSGLTAARMADTAWAMLSAAVAAGRLIEARGWMRLYKELKPIAREEAEPNRRGQRRLHRRCTVFRPRSATTHPPWPRPATATTLHSNCTVFRRPSATSHHRPRASPPRRIPCPERP